LRFWHAVCRWRRQHADAGDAAVLHRRLGALLAAGLASKFVPGWRISGPHLAAAVVGDVLLGYGARLAYGFNIGASFSGIASGSLHGWLWIVFALTGNWAGLFLRPLFKLPVM
jgi:hypothetical protein